MGHLNYYKNVIILIILLTLTNCSKSSTDSFNGFVENKYKKCNNSEVCLVDLKSLPFKWDKFYIFSENHFPEILTKDKISLVLGIEYDKDITLNDRLIIFTFKGKVVHEILTKYKKDNLIDSTPLLVDFYLDKETPLFFKNDNAKFIIKKDNSNYVLYWDNTDFNNNKVDP
ncbi:hypothetical protein [Chryseobacterium indologenes]|uniref:Uncharacterized protein n=1 Tax=Chryseobacterium indologenes TaxID=253 RepID=A0A0N0ITQ7_CHRID|nr:hypothetical protein [Chryseobacterium indologenes]KPE48963.1 hypothetical protein AOB46_22580 [Chryseobacterium indologenes]